MAAQSSKFHQTRQSRFEDSYRSRPARFLLGFCLSLAAFTRFGNPLTAADSHPNVVLIVADDLGWADLGCYGSQFHKTPNLDRLAREGMRFTQAYAAAPIGLPTRAAILTGRYPQRLSMTASFAVDPQATTRRLKPAEVSRQMPLAEVTIAEALKSAGYATACIGKWNVGGEGFGPRQQGFDVSIAGDATGTKYSEFAPYVDADGHTMPGLEAAPVGEYLTDRLTAEAEKFITDHKSQPFFIYMPQFAVHMPADAKPEVVAAYGTMPTEPQAGQINPVVAALIQSLDESVGRIVQTLEQQGLAEKTLILVTSDNGGVCNGNGQVIAATSNAPLRDGMGHLYEGGLRVPLIAKWPMQVKAGTTTDDIVSCLDFFPTLTEACGLPAAAASQVDGTSLLPTLRGTGRMARDALFWHFPHYNVNAGSRPGAAVRAGEWKLIEFYETGRQELFNVAKEASESNNLIEQQPEVARQLAGKLSAWRDHVGARPPVDNPDYAPNPQQEDGSVLMHSSTADVFGVMLRYEPLPHKDTLGYWVRAEDWVRFEFTMKRPGRYHLIPHVGCGTSGGSLVDFEVAGQNFSLKVPGTGHFQNFVPQDLGIVTFEKAGTYSLSIKPQKKEGVAVMDIRRIELKPVTVAEMLPELHLLEPFWRSETVYRESVLCVQDKPDEEAIGKLLFPAARIVAVHSADGRHSYQPDTDFVVPSDGKQIGCPSSSKIPFLKSSDLFMPKGVRPVWTGGAQPATPCALPHKTGEPDTHVLFDNGHWFHDQQIEVTYVRADRDWPEPVPKFDPQALPKTVARLKGKQKITIGVSGDSITYGLNASGLVGAPPFMPMYPDLVAAQLRATYGGEVNLVNRAVGGWAVPNGLADLDALLASEPDLLIIAYGMNDVGRRNPEAYREGIQQMLTRIKAARPDAEVILVATMVGNSEWTHTPQEMFPKYRDALISLRGPGVAVVDLTSIWTEMLRRKRDCDLTGNGVNHPSDFGHRVYASALLSLLVERP